MEEASALPVNNSDTGVRLEFVLVACRLCWRPALGYFVLFSPRFAWAGPRGAVLALVFTEIGEISRLLAIKGLLYIMA